MIVTDKEGEIVIVCVKDGDTLTLEVTLFVCVNEGEIDIVVVCVSEALGETVFEIVLVILGDCVDDTVCDIDDVIEILEDFVEVILGDFETETVLEDVTLLVVVLLGLSDFVVELVGLTLKLGVIELDGLVETGITKSRYATTPEDTTEKSVFQVINISLPLPYAVIGATFPEVEEINLELLVGPS